MPRYHAGFRLLGLSGSIRQGSTNTTIPRTLAEHFDDGVSLTLFPLDDVPLHNSDLEGERLPDAGRGAQECDRAKRRHRTLLAGIQSRHVRRAEECARLAFNSPLRNKARLTTTASLGCVGGVRAQAQLLDTLSSTLARLHLRSQVVIAGVMQKIAGGRLVDEDTVKFCLAPIDGCAQRDPPAVATDGLKQ